MPLSAVDAISPAMELTKQRMFRPMRYSQWWRLAVIGALAGEFSGGSSFNFNVPSGTTPHNRHLFMAGDPDKMAAMIALIMLGAAIGLLVMLAFIYISSVMRFQLFDATLQGRYQIREGWKFWKYRATPYFRLQLLILVVTFAGVALILATFGGIVWHTTQGFKNWHAAPIIAVVAGVLVLLFWAICIGVFSVFSKDFVVPMIALEGLGYRDAWARLRDMIAANKKDYTIYILMKIVLAIGGGVAMGLLAIAVILVIGVPSAIIGFILYLAFTAALKGTLGLVLLVTACIVLGLLAACTICILSAPLPVFYTAYALHFFASRYRPLYDAMFPPAPPQPEAPPEIPGGPEPSPAL